MKLVFGIHNHQPVGNFDYVIEHISEISYTPFLDVVEQHPDFRFALHITGPLLQWFEKNEPEYLERVAKLVRQNQVEMLGGGFYEPILAAIPEKDRIGQIKMMRDWLKNKLNADANGIWVAERVWEPQLAGSLAKADVDFALLDDFHFIQAGVDEISLTNGPVLTDDLGEEVSLLPINEKLRYLIPFHDPQETIEFCREHHKQNPDSVLVMVVDGEKFGAWPGTNDLVYKNRWLDNFLTALAAEKDWLELTLPSEVMADYKPSQRAYLPPNSYSEMSEWSLPMPAAGNYAKHRKQLLESDELSELKPFFRGGYWRQFFQKYEESLLMQRRCLLLHNEQNSPDANDHLWQAQCNCAYWHGVFGGLYLPHLRHAIYENIIAGTSYSGPQVTEVKLLGHNLPDMRIVCGDLTLFVSPDRGGSIIGMEDCRSNWNLQNTLRRRVEAYHLDIPDEDPTPVANDSASIHDLIREIPPGFRDAIIDDLYPRFSLIDRLLPVDAQYDSDSIHKLDQGDFCNTQYSSSLKRSGYFHDLPIDIERAITPGDNCFTVSWTITNNGKKQLSARFISEWNLALYDNESFLTDGSKVDDLNTELSELEVAIPLRDSKLKWKLSEDCSVLVKAVHTASQSESGYEMTYQQHQFLFGVLVQLDAGESVDFKIDFAINN
ncbi:DUF1926 domain-containing protein [bacterium]|nr:DUF1926 domain-containing protein [bacterium]